MTTRQTPGTISKSGTAPVFELAVIELLGADETRLCVSDLTAEARAEAISVRTVPRGNGADNVPQRRRRAIDDAGAPVVLLIEDTTRLEPGWAAALRAAFDDPRVAAVCGPVRVENRMPARYRALGRLEYGRFDGSSLNFHLPGNALALRLSGLNHALDPGEGLIEHELERRLVRLGHEVHGSTAFRAVYARPDRHGARLATRFGHGRLYGAIRGGNRAIGVLKAMLAMPVLSLRALRAARAAGPVRQWLPELPWILAMSTAWALGELTGQIAGKGNSEGSWN